LNRLTIFHTCVLSNFNFCPLSWHFCSETNTKKIEKIQERALRFVYQDYEASYENLLIKAKMSTQHIRRIRTMTLETFKILNGLAPPVLSNLVKKQDHKYNFRYINLLQIPQVKSSRYGKSSFRYAAPVLWNSLPDNYRNCSNFNEFKHLISFWNGKSCTCIACKNSYLFVTGRYTNTFSVLLFIFYFFALHYHFICVLYFVLCFAVFLCFIALCITCFTI
jgi:hypothetical protein